MNFGAIFSALLPRALGIGAAFVTTKLGEKTGIIVDPASLTAAGLAAYAGVHRIVSSKMNPGDAAKPKMVDADKKAVATGSAVIPAPPSR